MKHFKIAISTCPNDIFIFAPWILGLVSDLKEQISLFSFYDVEELNTFAFKEKFDLLKVSAATGLRLANKYVILSCGGAFGVTDGPKLVSLSKDSSRIKTIAVPGLNTTAYFLLQKAWDRSFEAVPMLFCDIPKAIETGQVDAGLLIHETALVYKEKGFHLLLDLGQWWANYTGHLPLPLGVILLHKKYSPVKQEVQSKIQESLETAHKKTGDVLPLVSSFAKELDEDTIKKHIDAYVNRYSFDYGEVGRQALETLKTIMGKKFVF
ncbi:MAG: MqnA/MqnD/SBP family protein [Desulfonauticus sp.]|nr:MqnA/MqnD/SBP family protein [Desulfonauticus sp.]